MMKRSFAISAIALFLLLPATSFAATLSLSPASGSYAVGDRITVKVLVSSPSASVNAVSGELSFSSSVLSVESVSKTASILNFWPIEPSISQSAGTVNFEGIAISGFQGSAGTVVSATFRAVREGTGKISFDNGQILANDGQGTDITSGLSGASFTITKKAGATSDASPAPAGTVVITSSTHPDQGKWYKATEVELNWKNPDDATAVRIGYDKYSTGVPTVVYNPLISQKVLSLKEGTWYFHLQERTADGWGGISTFRLRIDATPPHPLKITFPHGASGKDPQPLALFTTSDNLSGIDYYDVAVTGVSSVRISGDDLAEGPYPLPVTEPGQGSVEVRAYDKAGNVVSDRAHFEVIALESPVLNAIDDITTDQALEVSGTTYPEVHVDIFAKNRNGQVSSQGTESDSTGAFRLTWKEHLPSGVYSLTAQVKDKSGAKSFPSPEIVFQIRDQASFALWRLALNYLSLVLIVLAVLGTVLFCGWYVWQHFWRFRKRVLSKITKVEHSIHGQFDELKDALAEEVVALENVKSKRNLTVEEERMINRFKKMLDTSERQIEKEISDIVK